MRVKVVSWCEDLACLATVASSHPQAVYSIFTRCMMSHWSFLTRTVPDFQDLMLPLEESIHQVLIPVLTNHPPCSHIKRKILTLPARLGGLGIPDTCSTSQFSFESSLLLTKSLVDSIIAQDPSGHIDYTNLLSAKSNIRQSNRLQDIQLTQDLDNELDDH